MKSFRWLLILFCPVLFFACSKEKSFEQGSGTTYTAEWEFSEANNFFKGKMDTAYLEVFAGVNVLFLEGTSDDGKGFLNIAVPNINLSAPGTYKTPNVIFDYSKSTGVIYESDVTAINDFTLEVTSIDSAGVKGVFSGKVKDSLGAAKTITNGKFSAKLHRVNIQPPATGQVSFWSKNSCAGGPISVTINNQTQSITSFTASAPANCGAAGAANFTLPPGSYNWKAKCAGDSLTGVVQVTANGCVKAEVVFTQGTAAQYLLVSSGGNCSSIQVGGTYIKDKPLGDTNFIVVQVNVTTVGAYNITTNSMNGFSFAATGNFSNTGIQPVTLRATGTPQNATSTSFTVTGGASSCSFAVPVINPTTAPDLNKWSFTQGTKNYSGTFPDGGYFDDDYLGFGKGLDLFGEIPNTDSLFDLYIQFPASASAPIPGTYTTTTAPLDPVTHEFILFNNATQLPIYASKNYFTVPGTATITIIITSYDASTKVVRGTFSGTAYGPTGAVVPITNGKFAATVEF